MAAKGQITEDVVYRLAGSVGLDVDRLKRDMADPEIDRALKRQSGPRQGPRTFAAHPVSSSATTSFPGRSTLDALKTMIADARKQ